MNGIFSNMLKPIWMLLLAMPVISGCGSSTTSTPAPDALRPLIDIMNQRLVIANDVAQSKFFSGKPVQDSERERLVIANAETQAATYNLDKTDVRQFMTAQIEANKMVQYARIAHWHATQPPEPPTHSLTSGIRARLDTLQPQMMEKYAAFQPYRKDSACRQWVQIKIQQKTTDPITTTALQRATADLCVMSDTP